MVRIIFHFLILFIFIPKIEGKNFEHYSSCLNKKAAIVVDSNKKIIFERNAREKRYPASLTKLMTMYLLFDALKRGKINFDTKFKTSKSAIAQIPSKLGLKVGEKITVADIIKALAVKSANDAAVVAAEGLCGSVLNFCKLMNKKAKQLGLKNTHFENPSGVPNRNQITTAKDIATLGMAIFENFPQYWHFLSMKNFNYKGNNYFTHCKVLHWYKGSDGAKTGYIAASGFNLFVTANKYNKDKKSKRVFVVVMGGDNGKLRDLYAANLMDRYLSDYKICVNNVLAKSSEPKYNKKQRKSLLDQIDKSDINEAIIREEEEFNVNEILKTSCVDKKYFDELYENDEDEIKIEDEVYVKPRKLEKPLRKKRKTF